METPQRLAALLDAAVHRPAVRTAAAASRELTGLLLPSLCVLCGVRDGSVCPDCAPRLTAELLHPFRAERDAGALPLRSLGPSEAAAALEEPGESAPLPVVAAARYGAEASRALLAFKDHGRLPVVRFLRPAVYRALAAVPEQLGICGPFTLVPVPGSAAGYRRRGFDPVQELLGGALPPGWTVAHGWLAHRRAPAMEALRHRTSHAGSGSRQRRAGTRGRFRPTRRLAAHAPGAARGGTASVVLFDDVMTTGSTLAATWRALEDAGISPVGAVVLAAVTAPGPGSDEGLNSA
ncbi:phosphoribosyltransferase family protein [Citricoccus sp. NPDC055426]|uniref:ComF family protein n=1 Tax=Citricoccus sp. NPDC055426 TaxID=3155536 RepID=UPI0034206259